MKNPSFSASRISLTDLSRPMVMGEDGPREQDCVAQRQYGEHVGEFRLVYLYRIFALQHRDDAYLRPGR